MSNWHKAKYVATAVFYTTDKSLLRMHQKVYWMADTAAYTSKYRLRDRDREREWQTAKLMEYLR